MKVKKSNQVSNDLFSLTIKEERADKKTSVQYYKEMAKLSEKIHSLLPKERGQYQSTMKRLRVEYMKSLNPTISVVVTRNKERIDKIAMIKARFTKENTNFLKSTYERLYKEAKLTLQNMRKNSREQMRSKEVMVRNSDQRQDRIFFTKVGGVHGESNLFKKVNEIVKLEKPKVPANNKRHVGVEIEFACFLDKLAVADAFNKADLTNYVTLTHEYIRGRHEQEREYEISILAEEEKISDIIIQACDVLNNVLDANITYGCGLHVHLDARDRNIEKCAVNLFNCQELLYSIVPSIRRSNKHVRMLPKFVMFPTHQLVNGRCGLDHTGPCQDRCICKENKATPDRYYGINTWSYEKYKTIEIRMHTGTTNHNKIMNWINLLKKIVDGQIEKEVSTVDELKKFIDLEEKLCHYINVRTQNFKKRKDDMYV